MAKVINKTITTHLTNMKDVAEIVNWFCDEEMEPGTIVQRYGDALIIIGGRSGLCEGHQFESGTLGTVKVGVRIPQPRHLFPCSLVG